MLKKKTTPKFRPFFHFFSDFRKVWKPADQPLLSSGSLGNVGFQNIDSGKKKVFLSVFGQLAHWTATTPRGQGFKEKSELTHIWTFWASLSQGEKGCKRHSNYSSSSSSASPLVCEGPIKSYSTCTGVGCLQCVPEIISKGENLVPCYGFCFLSCADWAFALCLWICVYLSYQHAHSIPIVGVGIERRKSIGTMVTCKKGSTRYWNYLGDYWSCAGGLSAVNAIGTLLRDPINSGLTRRRMAV